jgi:hypothetical protein
MAGKSSASQKKPTNKKKASARQNADERIARRERVPEQGRPRAPRSNKANSQGRFPGETPLTGEDRPADRSGGKKRGQVASQARRGPR